MGEPLKIAVVGAGAVGSLLSCLISQLPTSRVSTYLVARGAQLQAARESGIRLEGWNGSNAEGDGLLHAKHLTYVESSPEAASALKQDFDYVIITVKAHAIPSTLAVVQPLLGERTTIVTVQNGVPWWFAYKSNIPSDVVNDIDLGCVDPDGIVWRTLGPERVLGALARVVVEVTRPGVVKTFAPWARFVVGEPSREESPRLKLFCSVLEEAGFGVELTGNIQKQVWSKLMGNAFFNPITTLTLQTWSELANSSHGLGLALGVMTEVFAVAKAAGVDMEEVSPEGHLDGFKAKISDFKSSMLQDLERGRQLEAGALLVAPVNVGKALGVPTPLLEALRDLTLMRQDVMSREQASQRAASSDGR